VKITQRQNEFRRFKMFRFRRRQTRFNRENSNIELDRLEINIFLENLIIDTLIDHNQFILFIFAEDKTNYNCFVAYRQLGRTSLSLFFSFFF
jgi:hypothetical protein